MRQASFGRCPYQELGYQQAADYRQTERAARFGSGPEAERYRKRPHQRGHRRHHDGAKAYQRTFYDRIRQCRGLRPHPSGPGRVRPSLLLRPHPSGPGRVRPSLLRRRAQRGILIRLCRYHVCILIANVGGGSLDSGLSIRKSGLLIVDLSLQYCRVKLRYDLPALYL